MDPRFPNPLTVPERINTLVKLREKYNLNRLLDYGAPMANTGFNITESIEINDDITGPNIFNGDYVTLLPEHLGNDTCYTCFVFINSEKLEKTNQMISEYQQIKQILFDANLTNSFLVVWIRTVQPEQKQECVIYDLENKVDISDSILIMQP